MNKRRLSILLIIALVFTFSLAGFGYGETDTKAEYDDYVEHATKPAITLKLTVTAE